MLTSGETQLKQIKYAYMSLIQGNSRGHYGDVEMQD